jgi:formylglycine-generating enzyme required for sulfatase activity
VLEEYGINGYCVAKSVPMPGGYSIDATEVTRSQYQAWLSTNPSTATQPPFCDWNTSFQPSHFPGTDDNHPVGGVDWCDAHAYCHAVGKRLCGKIGGWTNAYDDYADASKSQWYAACSSGGNKVYPYGDVYDGQACNGEAMGLIEASEVGSLSSCQSSVPGYEGVYDMSGNVIEWEDSCNGITGEKDRCRLRGGNFYNDHNHRCDDGATFPRNAHYDDFGIRCCSSP